MTNEQILIEHKRLLNNVNKAIGEVNASGGQEMYWDFKDAAEDALKVFERKYTKQLKKLLK